MRLIDVDTLTVQEFAGSAAPAYAILSHTWGQDEVSYQDIQDLELAQTKDGFEKIYYACAQAKAHDLKWLWVDTCCIDKSSSHELSEAINSMYRWYMNAAVCYVYLTDVPGSCPELNDEDYLHPTDMRWIEAFEESRWFTRGWTLQELIAPRTVLFFGSAWNPIGALKNMIQRVAGITNIQSDVLDHSRPLSDLSVARRLSWAATRETTRKEDEAYSLFGILDVNMPLLYGEGSKAFLRLQEEIIRHSTDQSIFAWDAPSGFIESRELLLAPSPRCFMNGSKIRRRRGTAVESAFRVSNKGLEITLPIMRRRLHEDPARPYVTLGILDCKYEGSSDVLALVMSQHPFNIEGGTAALELYVSGYERRIETGPQYGRLIPISPADLVEAKPNLLTITKDLQSQTYIQTFNTNEMSWFPVRFMGSDPSSLPTLRDVFPEHCWYEGSRTMRLRAPHSPYGGIVVNIKDNRSVLIPFGMYNATLKANTSARGIYKPVFFDPACPMESHVRALMQNNARKASPISELRINDKERIIARLWSGALTVSIESAIDDQIYTPSSTGTLSPPMSPLASPRPLSLSGVPRRDSMLQDNRSERSDNSYFDLQQEPHRTSLCEHCRAVREKRLAERDRRRAEQIRAAEEKETERQKAARSRKMKQTATKAGVGISMGSILMEVAEYL